MAKTVGYLITWTTYGTWLQGHGKGWVKDGEVLKKNEQLRRDNERRLIKNAVRFGKKEKRIVNDAITDEARRGGINLGALAVCSNHVHLVGRYSLCPIGDIVRKFKNASTLALKKHGIKGKIWTKGYDKRFCFNETALKNRIEYVNRQDGQ